MINSLSIIPVGLFILVVLLVTVKLVLFFSSTSYRTVGRFIYFKPESIYISPSMKRQRAKKLQNGLTVAIGIVTVLSLFTLLLFK